MYSDKVIEHFMCPQNAYSMPDADAEGSFGDPTMRRLSYDLY